MYTNKRLRCQIWSETHLSSLFLANHPHTLITLVAIAIELQLWTGCCVVLLLLYFWPYLIKKVNINQISLSTEPIINLSADFTSTRHAYKQVQSQDNELLKLHSLNTCTVTCLLNWLCEQLGIIDKPIFCSKLKNLYMKSCTVKRAASLLYWWVTI